MAFGAKLAADSTAVHRWNLREGGGVFAVGVGGGITGRGADVLILDDLHNDAGTEGDCERVYEWFSTIAVPRLEPNGSIVLIGTRFHEADVFGRILESPLAKDWRVVRIPAFAEVDDPLGRDVGASLWSSRVTAEELAERREAMGSRAFESQFQQNPLPATGSLIKADWLEHRYDSVPDGLSISMALDSASKTGVSNDFSVLGLAGSNRSHHLLLEVVRRKVDFPDLRRMVLLANEKYRPSAFYIEDTANATGLIQELRRETRLPIVPVTPKGSKLSRIEGITGLLEAGKLLLPNERKIPAPWLLEFLRECLAYPNGRFDDQPDMLALLLSKVARSSNGFYFAKLSNPPMPAGRW